MLVAFESLEAGRPDFETAVLPVTGWRPGHRLGHTAGRTRRP